MKSITFIDTEIEPRSGKILDIGGVRDNGAVFHKPSVPDFVSFIRGSHYVCGHNIINHDALYIGHALNSAGIAPAAIIDTLFLSPLLFPTKPYHALLKDDKLQSDSINNPFNDSCKARDLFYAEIAAFSQIDETLKQILYLLLHDKKEFQAFFSFVSYTCPYTDIGNLIRHMFKRDICENADLTKIVAAQPIELAYCVSLIASFVHHREIHSITPPWVLKNFPDVEPIMFRLRNKPCIRGCDYCDAALNISKGLKRFFGFDAYRTYGGEPLQENAVKAAVDGKSLLAVFPTGGGKSITFQVPALMSGESSNGLTVVISPLQSLMKDQVDNLEKQGITDAVTINGLIDPIERAKSLERVEDGSASLLYISPEALRSRTIERLILGRKLVRFVIDEAHCFSSWGQDFRVDYLYIGDFIKAIQEKKCLAEPIPVSCFTATAKQKVIADIRDYFRDKLSIDLELYTSKASRTNLHYKVYEKQDEEDKYQAVRDLIEKKNCPTIIYVSRTQKAYSLAERLTEDGFSAKPYHGKMDKKEKSANQNAFIEGAVQIMVATSAFGMGVDKKDVGMVIHYEISDSLENYIQEAGRAGRDEHIVADCYVLFNDEDLSKHFILLNQTKVSVKEIQQVWRAIKELTRFRSTVSNSALEIARKSGWDDSVKEIETRVTTAIAALEDAGYLKRGQNMPRVFADSILSKNAQEAIDKINASGKFAEEQKENAIRIIKKLISCRSRLRNTDEDAESRIDYISDHLGIEKAEVINIVNLLREEKILADVKDLSAFIRKSENKNRSLAIVESFGSIETFLLSVLDEEGKTFHIKELNEKAESAGCSDVTTTKIKTVCNFWAIKNWIRRQNLEYSKNHFAAMCLYPKKQLREKLEKRRELATFIIKYLYEKVNGNVKTADSGKEEVLVEFSVHELKDAYAASPNLFRLDVDIFDVEDALFYLSRIEALKIEGGFLVVYNCLTIERLELDNRKKYTKDNYSKLGQHYENKAQQIHIVGEYARKMIDDYRSALQFVDDYFQLNYTSFLSKYFPGSKANDLRLKMTPAKFKQLFGQLSPTQLTIINDNESRYIVVAAGPGSGKTKVLVHKLASLLLMEDVKHEQLLMLTFSRAAVTEFKTRLLSLIGNAANYVEIKTFHSYCFDLLGKVGTLVKSDEIVKNTIENINNKSVEACKITKAVLVIDEVQDMNEDEFNLIHTLMEQNEEMRVIAVGDDDQSIFGFRGASQQYLAKFVKSDRVVKYELVENYRSRNNLVEFSNQFVKQITDRLKSMPIIAHQTDNGRIKLIRYQCECLISPLVDDILTTPLTGTTCVLTTTNDDALQITGLLLKNGMPAKLIQTNDGFDLYNLSEIRYFLDCLNFSDANVIISDEVWNNAKQGLGIKFYNSTKLELCNDIIRAFEVTNPNRKYKTDLEIFIRESRLEDFFNENGETIFVSTIHKAKGKEFDNVFIMLQNYYPDTDDDRRLLYVALTRAKSTLVVHLNSHFLDYISVENLQHFADKGIYSQPNEVIIDLTYKDVWLDYFISRQHLISQLISDDTLVINGNECQNANGQTVLKFSQQFVKRLESMNNLHYTLKAAKVNFVIYWRKEGAESEVKIILPELYLEKVDE